jgi:hypothetical protein
MKVIGMESRRKRGEYVMGGEMDLDMNEISRRVVCGRNAKFIVHSDQPLADDIAKKVRSKGAGSVGTIDPCIDPGDYQWGFDGNHVQIFLLEETEDQYVGNLIGVLVRAGAVSVSVCTKDGMVPSQ